MEICINDYVRTDKGYIVKIDEEKKNLQMLKFLDVEYGNIVKHSSNIIDLIECGDYVNGMKVCKINEPSLANDYKRIVYCNEDEGLYEGIFTNDDIKSILTHERFSSLEYII